MDPDPRPIGWWVKRLDTLLDEAVDSVLAGEQLARRHWQVLHSLGDEPVQEPALHAGLADFADPEEVAGVVADLVGRGWAVSGPGGVRLTPDGVLAHDRVARSVGRVRRHVADGLSRQEYERTVLVLSRMVENIERALGRR